MPVFMCNSMDFFGLKYTLTQIQVTKQTSHTYLYPPESQSTLVVGKVKLPQYCQKISFYFLDFMEFHYTCDMCDHISTLISPMQNLYTFR